MGLTELVFELIYFKDEISAILKRHCDQGNGSYVTFVTKFELFRYYFIKLKHAFQQVINAQNIGRRSLIFHFFKILY